MKLYSVSIPRSAEDTEWYIVADSSEQAVQIYVDGVISEDLSVDEEELIETGVLHVDLMGRDAKGDARFIEWGGDEEITISMRPLETSQVQITSHPDWPRWDAHFNSVGLHR